MMFSNLPPMLQQQDFFVSNSDMLRSARFYVPLTKAQIEEARKPTLTVRVQRHEHVEYKSPWMDLFADMAKDAKIGAVLRIRLPNGVVMTDGVADCDTCEGTKEVDNRLGGPATAGISPCPDCC